MKPLKVAILWHMHQPDYRDPVSGRTLLPWTYLHAVKDYDEMLRTAQEVPGTRLTFNLVPTMLEQLERYARGEAGDLWIEAAAKDPAKMGPEERAFLVEQFFSVHADRHILPYPRYRELARRKDSAPRNPAALFEDQDLRDLQVWFLLAWSGYHLRRDSELIQYLLGKGQKFSEADKRQLLDLYDQVVAGVTERYRQLEQEGVIEISVTPFAHPILPLLCGTDTADQATPGIQLPAVPFCHPADARLQVRHGLSYVSRCLGERPRGMWPSEGSVSAEVASILKEEGALWAATDEGILAKSLSGGLGDRRRLYKPYNYQGLPLFFRDLELSDRIGFVYAHWDPKRAAADLLGRLRQLAKLAPGGVVPLILDGENCWERYQDNGHPFLVELYKGLLADPDLEMVTFAEALESVPSAPLPRLEPGSWINSDFCIWIGHPEENTAWEWLERARRDVNVEEQVQALLKAPEQPIPETILHLLRAEGSDWFWWFGDDHVTAQADIFDRLFRRHLEALYHEAGLPVPQHLYQFIKTPKTTAVVREPTALFSPIIDGRISDYFEWLAAGSADLSAGGAMHAAHSEFSVLHYGYDKHFFYLRLDPEEDLASLMGPSGVLEIHLSTDADWIARVRPERGELALVETATGKTVGSGTGACERVVELAIPLQPLKLKDGDRLAVSFLLRNDGQEAGRWPAEGPLQLPYRGESLELDDWFV